MNPKSGGPCQGIRNVNSYIKQLGTEVEVLCMDDTYEDYSSTDDFIIHKLGKGKTSYQYQPLVYDWLMKNALSFDCIVVHGLWQHYNVAVFNAVKQLKKNNNKAPKVVIMPHGMLDPYFQNAPDRKWKALRNEFVWRFVEKKCINNADAIFFTCQEELRLAATTFNGYKPNKTFNVGYGIQDPPQNRDEFKNAFEQKCSVVKDKKYWLFLSRIHYKKGVDLLIKAYNELSKENSSLPELVIAGPIESSYAQEMIKLASDNSKIHFPGMLQGEEKWGAFYGCEVYLLPSHQENFGIAIVEAMACAKPVLITKHINIWKEIEYGNAGWILEELSVNSLKIMFLQILYNDDFQLDILGKNAFNTYVDKFKVEKFAVTFIDNLKSL